MGLTGMHIIHKTAKLNTAEVWSTFEHVDNSPDNPQQAQQSNTVWSFYNPQCFDCVPNKAPEPLKSDGGKYIWQTNMPYAAKYGVAAPGQFSSQRYGTQAVRVYPIYKCTAMLNSIWQEKLKGTVWANYRLIGTQWQKNENPGGPMAPTYLGNVTLETFIQKNSSCISCHSGATITFNTDTIKTNLSFLFGTYARSGLLATKNKK